MIVKFGLNKAESKMGQNVFVVGNKGFIGNWDPSKAHKLSTNKGIYPRWESKTGV